ncbi:hypothetical protein R6Q59_010190 [Mikania micrantha]
MKFGANFQESLQHDAYPQEWIDSAISYKKLKKCIKRVQQELESLGLDHETLEKLWQHVGVGATSTVYTDGSEESNDDRPLHYDFLTRNGTKFVPKLTIALDPKDGSPMDAWLSPETRRVLRQVGRRRSTIKATSHGLHHESLPHIHSPGSESTDASETHSPDSEDTTDYVETVEIPLTSDSEFFQILRKELNNLATLQNTEQKQMELSIMKLGEDIRDLKDSKKKRSKEEIEAWREIFRLYLDSQIFMSSHEHDAGARDAAHAQKQLEYFRKTLTTAQSNKIKISKDASASVERFMLININLLRLLKYQEINQTALTKILKKFDKHTALRSQQSVLTHLKQQQTFMTQDLAKATCFTISEELIRLLPQLDDYLCPVCFSITFKPVRLRCNHVFCIRCLIVMQRDDADHCPLCREKVVLEATEAHLDENLARFLKQNFPEEVKQKQRENEIAAGIDRFGEGYTGGNHKCIVM